MLWRIYMKIGMQRDLSLIFYVWKNRNDRQKYLWDIYVLKNVHRFMGHPVIGHIFTFLMQKTLDNNMKVREKWLTTLLVIWPVICLILGLNYSNVSYVI